MSETIYSSLIGRVIAFFLCVCVLWVILFHLAVSRLWDIESYGLSGRLVADALFLGVAATLFLVLLRRAIREVCENENEVGRSDDRARVAVEASGEGVWDINSPSPAESYSGEVFSMLGMQPVTTDDMFLTFNERIHPDDRAKLQQANAFIQKPGQDQFRLRCRLRHADGCWRHISLRGRCVERTPGGRPARITGILSDVTEESKREADLIAARNTLNALLKAMPFSVAILDANGNVKSASDSWCRFAAGRGLPVTWLSPLESDRSPQQASLESHPDLREALQAVLRGQKPEAKLPMRAGGPNTHAWPETHLRAYKADNKVAGVVVALNDLTEGLDRIEELLRQTGELRQEIEGLQRQNEDLERRTGELQRQNDALQSLNVELQGRTEELQRQTNELQGKNEDLLHKNAKRQHEFDSLHVRAQDLECLTEELHLQNDELQRRAESLLLQKQDVQHQNDTLQRRVEDLQRQNEEIECRTQDVQHQTEAIQRAHNQFKFAVDSSPLAILGLDENLHVVKFCNPAVEALFGWPSDQVLGHRAPMIPSDEEPTFRELYRQAIQTNASQEFQTKCQRKDGQLRDVSLWVIAVRDNAATGGQVMLVTMSDITEQLRDTRELRQAKREFERMFERLPQAIVVVDPETDVIWTCSPAAKTVLGYSPEDLTGRPAFELYRDEADYGEFCLWLKTALDADRAFHRTCRMRHADGHEFNAVQTVVPINGSQDRRQLMVVVDELAESPESMSTEHPGMDANAPDLRNIGAMIYRSINSQDWVLAFASEGTRDVTGYAPGAFTQPGYPFYKEIIYEPDRQHVLDHITEAILRTGQFDLRYKIKSASGELRWVEHQGTVVKSPDGNGEWLEGMVVDITRDVRLRDALSMHRQQMQSLLYHVVQGIEQVREDVADRIQRSVAGHLLSSSSGVHGVADRIRKKGLVSELQSIQTSLEVAIEECNTVAAEMNPPVLNRLGLNAALEYLLRDFRIRHRLHSTLKWSGPADRVDRRLEKFLYRATEELVQNVLRHAGVSELKVSVRVRDGLIRVAVKDQGRGFQNADTPSKEKSDRGYGLFMIRECAAHLGGTLTVATRPDTGSSVSIEIPLDREIPSP